ncbi:uncharacterized protein LOC8055589 isoform X2 [Sorghum bicolor]|nr:uncharacterized protein LOC8055589 isoform X2 [Sorghum bicolor]|eukprot:XP_021308433.1 uncharacterized protein LOC8055589 isoform X2 [Sorghum bicolor]
MEITERLKQHGAIFNVALSPPNFIIHLTTLELQLQILSCKTFSGPDFLLDILPWCLEHGSFDLPWIIKSSDQDTQMTPKRHYLQILATQSEPLRHVSALASGHHIGSTQQDRTPHHPDTESSISISSDDEQGWESDRSMNIPDTDA